jgi:hypothetical protein
MIDKIKIGGIIYNVENVERLQGSELEALDGKICFAKSTITLNTSLNDQTRLQTLFHKILHGIFMQSGHVQTEDVVDSTAYGILQVLRDNHAIMDAVMELNKGMEAVK